MTPKLRLVDTTINGAALLDELLEALQRYVVFPSTEAGYALALWIAATHAQDAWEHAPRCVVTSPEKRCGKSRLLDIAEATAYESLVTVNISPAALVRSITDTDPPTLFIDEADTIFGAKVKDNNEDLRGIVNSGHQRNRPYIRWDISTRSNEKCPTFAMALLAGIGELPDTIMDRAIVLRMRRRAPGEQVAPYRTRRDRPALHDLRDRLHTWINPLVEKLTTVEPIMPLEDRAADTWEPLFAIADLAGAHWPKRAKSAATAMVGAEDKADVEASIGGRLLADIKGLFEPAHLSFMSSLDLVNQLRRIGDAPWSELDLTMRKLSIRLGAYGVKPGQNSAKTARGYHFVDFADPFKRYLVSPSVQVSEDDADQQERPDTLEPTDTSMCPDESMCPDVSAGEPLFTDTWTLPDGSVGENSDCSVCGFPYDSNGHESNCGAA